jgi:hypothetical protein
VISQEIGNRPDPLLGPVFVVSGFSPCGSFGCSGGLVVAFGVEGELAQQLPTQLPTQLPPNSPPRRPPEPPSWPEPLSGGGCALLWGGGGEGSENGTAYQMVRRVQCPGEVRLPEHVTITSCSGPRGRNAFLRGTLLAG